MIGIFGGTFDPVHYGHLKTVIYVQEALQLEQVRLVPLGMAVHREQPVASSSQRLEMLYAATSDQPNLVVDDRETKRPGGSYTVDTLKSLKQEFPGKTLCLIIGSDAFCGFHNWHQPGTILTLAHLIVMQRPNAVLQMATESQKLLNGHFVKTIAQLNQKQAGSILIQQVPQLDISSTEIRQRLQQGQPVNNMIPLSVYELIRQRGLYAKAASSPA